MDSDMRHSLDNIACQGCRELTKKLTKLKRELSASESALTMERLRKDYISLDAYNDVVAELEEIKKKRKVPDKLDYGNWRSRTPEEEIQKRVMMKVNEILDYLKPRGGE